MLFALIDYAHYRMQRGRYHRAKIEAAGYRLATLENFSGVRHPRPADVIVFHTRTSALSWLVMYFTNSVASHVAMMTDEENVTEVTTSGVVRHPFTDLLDRQSFLACGSPPDLTDEKRAAVGAAADQMLDARFDWLLAARMGARESVWAKHAHYNPRLYADAAMTVFVLGRVALSRAPTWCQLTPLLAYSLTVCANRAAAPFVPVRAKSRLRLAAHQAARTDALGAVAVTSILTSKSRHAPAAAIAVVLRELRVTGGPREEKFDDLVRLLTLIQQAKDRRTSAFGTLLYGQLIAVMGGPERRQQAKTVLRRVASDADVDVAASGAFGLGLTLEVEDPAAAAGVYQRIIDLGHSEWSPRAGVNLGCLLVQQGEIEEALRVLSWTVASRHPDAATRAGTLLDGLRAALGNVPAQHPD